MKTAWLAAKIDGVKLNNVSPDRLLAAQYARKIREARPIRVNSYRGKRVLGCFLALFEQFAEFPLALTVMGARGIQFGERASIASLKAVFVKEKRSAIDLAGNALIEPRVAAGTDSPLLHELATLCRLAR